MNDDTELSLVLTVSEINMVLNTLAKPIENVNALIKKIKQQGETQIAKYNQEQEQSGIIQEEEPE